MKLLFNRFRMTSLFFLSLLVSLSTTQVLAGSVDPKLPNYNQTLGVSGKISSVGSDTLANLMTLWSEEFKRVYPNVSVQIQAAGSSTAPPALAQAMSDFGPMSRMMKDSEIKSFESQYGYKPTPIPVAIDALAVFVNKDNPIKGLSIEQIDAIFSSTRKCGGKNDLSRWSQLGVSGALAAQSIQLFGRNSVSGTYGYFKSTALCKGDYKSSVNEQPGSASVVQSVTASINGIGYSGIGYRTAGVRALPVSRGNGPLIEPSVEEASKGTYPLSRFLYVYINKAPNSQLQPKVKEFMKMVLSKTGQMVVVKDGYIPLPERVAKEARALLDN